MSPKRPIWKTIQTIFFTCGAIAAWTLWWDYFVVGPLQHPVNTVIYFVASTLMSVLIIYVVVKTWEYD